MSSIQININADAAVIFTNKLEKIGKTALPNAIRSALNSAAFDVKQKSMPAMAKKEFVDRNPNFFKANSRVEMAKGNDIKSMKSIVGFVEKGLKGKSNFAVKDLEQQETGGRIKGKSFIPMKDARTSKSLNKMVKPINRLRNISKIIETKNVKSSGNKKQKFIRAAIMAKKFYGKDAYVLNNWAGGRHTLSRIDQISSNMESRKLEIKRTVIYSFKKGRNIAVKGTRFMQRASHESGLKISDFYVRAARVQLNKFIK